MKTSTILAVFTAIIFTAFSYSQDNIGSSVSTNQPTEQERIQGEYRGQNTPFYPSYLDDQLKAAQESGNTVEAKRLEDLINSSIPSENKYPKQTDVPVETPRPVIEAPVPFQNQGDWYTSDVTVYSGAIKFGDPYFRQLDMKMGEDGNMYVALNRAPVSGTNGRIDVYRSSNGGATWVYTNGLVYTTAYISNVSILVELRDTGNLDSNRIFVFYTVSTTSNNDGASMSFGSWRRNGTAWYAGTIANPPAGMEYSFASGVSDGAFYSGATWIGCFCTESNNALTTTTDFRYYRSINWGQTWTGVTISTAYNDFYPSAEFRRNTGPSSDSVWIAVERRFSATNYEIRIIRTPWTPSATSNTYFVTAGGAGVKYEKPALTIKQNQPTDSALFTTTKNGVSYYCPTVNGGGAWSTDFTLGGTANGNNKVFTLCSSSPNGANPFNAVWVSSDGDSINLRVGGRIGNLGTTAYKRNSNNSSTSVSPTVMVYAPNSSTNLCAFSYAGFGPTNIYTNQEGLITGITQNGNTVPKSYSLDQNYPNPFNPTTNIKFSIPNAGVVKIAVYDVMGRKVTDLVNEHLNAGSYTTDFNAVSLSSGIYFYTITADGFTETKKMMLIK